MEIPAKEKTQGELKEFGLVMALALFVMSIIVFFVGHQWWRWSFLVGLLFVAGAYLCPRLLGPIEKGWMAFAFVLSAIMTRVILVSTFFVGITPMSFLVRLMGKDLLSLKWDPDQDSYWVDVDQDGPGSRHYLPY
jgi:hypothetical protein